MLRSLKLSLFDAFFFSLMVGAGETYLPAFALSQGLGETEAGLFTTLPMVIGAIIQLITPFGVQKVGSIKRWVVYSVAIQAMAFLPLIYFSIYGVKQTYLLFVVASVYWGAGFAAGPSWNYWMARLVPGNVSAKFFSTRSGIQQIGVFLGVVSAGVCLHNKVTLGPITSVFALIFTAAFLARASSSLFLAAKDYQDDWTEDSVKSSGTKFWQVVIDISKNKNDRHFFGFLFLFYVAIFISSPFVNPFFIEKMKMSYGQYMGAISALMIGKMLVLPWIGKVFDRFGVQKVFLVGALGISPLPALWVLSQEYWFTLCLQMVSGGFWAIFEVGLLLIFFGQLKQDRKIPVLTLYNLFNASSMIIGTFIGGVFLHSLGESLNGYFTIFIFGCCLRLCVVGLYWFFSFRKLYSVTQEA